MTVRLHVKNHLPTSQIGNDSEEVKVAYLSPHSALLILKLRHHPEVVASRRNLLILGILVLQVLTISGLVIALSWNEKPAGVSSSMADLQPYTEVDANPQIRDLMPRPQDSAHDIIQNASFWTSSSLKSYLEVFPDEFAFHLFKLNANQLIVDAGAGDALFTEQYVSLTEDPEPERKLRETLQRPFNRFLATGLKSRASVVAIDLEKRRRDIPDHNGKFRLLSGRLFEDIPDLEIGQADLLVDCLGVMAYSPELHKALEKEIRLLRDSGTLYLYLGRIPKSHFRKQQSYVHEMGEENSPGMDGSVEGLSITPVYADGRRMENFSLKIQITNRKEIRVPSLELITIRVGNKAPPYRLYQEKD